MITRKDFENIDRLHCEGTDVHTDLWELSEQLLKERDSYREVAIEFMKATTMKEHAKELVDAEAQKIMAGRGGK